MTIAPRPHPVLRLAFGPGRWVLVLFFVALPTRKLDAGANGASDVPCSQTVRHAHELLLNALPRGCGSATVRRWEKVGDGVPETETFHVEFWFEGVKSRTDRYDVPMDSAKRQLRGAHISTGELTAQYGALHHTLVVRSDPGDISWRYTLGSDFQPEVFVRPDQLPLWREVEGWERYVGKLTCSLERNGRLVIHGEGSPNKPQWKSTFHCELDGLRGLRIEEYRRRSELPPTGLLREVSYNASFGAKMHESYPVTVKYELYEQGYKVRSDSLPEPKAGMPEFVFLPDFRRRIEVAIDTLEAPEDIDDAIFTVAGLKAPPGTQVYDAIADVRYVIGAIGRRAEELSQLAASKRDGGHALTPTSTKPERDNEPVARPPTAEGKAVAIPARPAPPDSGPLWRDEPSAVNPIKGDSGTRGGTIWRLLLLGLGAVLLGSAGIVMLRGRKRNAAGGGVHR